MTDREKAGEIQIEITETTWSTITLKISKTDLETHDCAHLREFRDKIRAGEIDPFDFDPIWGEADESMLEECKHREAKAVLPDGTELEDD